MSTESPDCSGKKESELVMPIKFAVSPCKNSKETSWGAQIQTNLDVLSMCESKIWLEGQYHIFNFLDFNKIQEVSFLGNKHK